MESDSNRVPFTIDIEDVLRLFGTEGILYSRDHDVFFRELVQNSMDAIERYMAYELKYGRNILDYRGEISISYVKDDDANKIIIEDNGIGIDEREFKDNLLHPLKGLYFLLQEQGIEDKSKFIGYFGVGLLSAFKVSDLIEIESKRDDDSRKLTIKIKRSGNSQKLQPEAFIAPFTREIRGTKIIIHLRSVDKDVNRRIKMIDSSPKILDALRYYIRHPKRVRIFFIDESNQKIEIENVHYQGSDITPRREINFAGVRGCIAYRGERAQSRFQVCQKGILVNENYFALLPNDSTSLFGEIDLTTTTRVNLSLSREEIIDNKKFKKLKEDISNEISEFIKNEFTQWSQRIETKQRRTGPDNTKNTMHEDGSHAFDMLVKVPDSEHPEIIKHQIFETIAFYVESEDKHMLINQIIDLCKEKELKKVYVYSLNVNTCYPALSLTGSELLVRDLSHEVYVDLLKDRRQIVIRLTEKSRENPVKYSFRKLIAERLEEEGFRVTDVFSIENQLDGEELPGSPHKKTKLVKIQSRKDKQVYRINGWNSFEKILVNAENEEIKHTLELFNGIGSDERKKAIYEAYINILAGDFDQSLKVLKELLSLDK